MKKTQADMIFEEWKAYHTPESQYLAWSTLLDEAIEIGDEFIDWETDITYVRFKDGSILSWDCFFIRPGTEEEIRDLM